MLLKGTPRPSPLLVPHLACRQRAFASNNFVGFFKLVRQAPYLLACLSHIYFGQVRLTLLVAAEAHQGLHGSGASPARGCLQGWHAALLACGPLLSKGQPSPAGPCAGGLQVRGRALRALGDTLAPKVDTPVALELSWLAVSPTGV